MRKYPLSSLDINSIEDDVRARYEMALEVHKDVLATNKKHRSVLDKQLKLQEQMVKLLADLLSPKDTEKAQLAQPSRKEGDSTDE